MVQSRGQVDIKGKGHIPTFWVQGLVGNIGSGVFWSFSCAEAIEAESLRIGIDNQFLVHHAGTVHTMTLQSEHLINSFTT